MCGGDNEGLVSVNNTNYVTRPQSGVTIRQNIKYQVRHITGNIKSALLMRADDLLILQMMIVNPHNPIVFKLTQNRQSLNSSKITTKNTEKSGREN